MCAADDVVKNSAIDLFMVSIGQLARNISDFAGATAPINPGHEVFDLAAARQHLCGSIWQG